MKVYVFHYKVTVLSDNHIELKKISLDLFQNFHEPSIIRNKIIIFVAQ